MARPQHPDDAAPTPGELAMADTCIQLALQHGLATTHNGFAELTLEGLHVLAALAALADARVDVLVADGHGALLDLPDMPAKAYALIELEEARLWGSQP